MAAPPPTALSYSELYADAARNPFRLDEEGKEMCYAAIYEVWRSTLNPMTVKTLHQNILTDFSRPVGALGIFVQDAGSATGVLKLVHGVHSFPGSPGQTRDRMTTLAFEGDVSGVDICTVAFEPKQLEIMVDVNVPGSMERVMQLLNDEPGRETLGPFAAIDANVRTTKTRGMAYFPFEFIEPLLGADLTSRQVFELIVPALIDAGLQDTCASLIEFLTVSLVQPTTDVETPLTVHAQAGNKVSHSPGPTTINHRREHVLYRDLPALRPSALLPAASDPALFEVAKGMRDMVVEARADRNDRADHRDTSRRPKTTRDKMGDRITDRLLVLCRATSDEDLPPLYHEWASERYVLQQAIEASCAALSVPVF
jgi:hypothetical protein